MLDGGIRRADVMEGTDYIVDDANLCFNIVYHFMWNLSMVLLTREHRCYEITGQIVKAIYLSIPRRIAKHTRCQNHKRNTFVRITEFEEMVSKLIDKGLLQTVTAHYPL